MEKLVGLIDHMGSDLTVVNAARVSMAKHSNELTEADQKLIGYLARNGHWTPFAHPQVQLRIKMPIFVARQWMRTTVGMAFNEVSRRYVDDAPECYIPTDYRARPEKSIKQGSGVPIDEYMNQQVLELVSDFTTQAIGVYGELLEMGVAPEQARIVLPQSLYTEFYQTGSLYAFSRLCRQRLDSHAQVETRQYAELVQDIIQPLFPLSWAALMQPQQER